MGVLLACATSLYAQTQTVQYTYDSLDRLTSVRSADRLVEYTYDAAGNRLVKLVTALNPIPVTASVSLTGVWAGAADTDVTVTGAGFVDGSIVQWKGEARTTVFVSASELRVHLLASDLSSAGAADVTVVNPAPGGGVSAAVSVTVANPAPIVATLTPSQATAGGAAFTVTLQGSGFVTSTVVHWKGSARATTYVSSTEIRAAILAPDLTAAGGAAVTAVNPAPGGGTSPGVTFTVLGEAPTVTGVTPSSGPSAGGTTVTMTGTNFAAGAAVAMGGTAAVGVIVVNATTITATAPAHAAALTDVVVTNPDGQSATLASAFTYVAAPPTVTALSPASGPIGSAVTLTGTNFTGATVATFNGVGAAFTVAGDTQITAAVPAGTTTGLVRVTTPGGTATSASAFIVTDQRATRTLPACYVAGYPITVTQDLAAAPSVLAQAIDEQPPANWTRGAISDSGAWDGNTSKLKWGPFFDTTARIITYELTPPADAADPGTFTGVARFDGIEVPVGGPTTLARCEAHPADADRDFRLAIGEVTAYGAAWKRGSTWATPPVPIPIGYVTRAGYLWRSGETYRRDPGACPACWVPLGAAPPPPVPVLSRTRFLAFGDSLTQGVDSPPVPLALWQLPDWPYAYPYKLGDLLKARYTAQTITVLNDGLWGEFIDDGLARLPSDVRDYQPDALLLLEGANDLLGAPSEATATYIAGRLEDMIRAARLQKSDIVIMLATFPPQYAGSLGAGAPYVATLNDKIAALAAAQGVILVDLYRDFVAQGTRLIGEDGLHPTDAGFTQMAQSFYIAALANLEVTPSATQGIR